MVHVDTDSGASGDPFSLPWAVRVGGSIPAASYGSSAVGQGLPVKNIAEADAASVQTHLLTKNNVKDFDRDTVVEGDYEPTQAASTFVDEDQTLASRRASHLKARTGATQSKFELTAASKMYKLDSSADYLTKLCQNAAVGQIEPRNGAIQAAAAASPDVAKKKKDAVKRNDDAASIMSRALDGIRSTGGASLIDTKSSGF